VVPVDGALRYDEGLFIGYRGYQRDNRPVWYPFGHGLGYTTCEYQAVTIPDSVRPGADVNVTVEVRNTGGRRGRDVVQVYASKPESAVERPMRWLAGFTVVDADPGQTVQVPVTLPARALQHWTP
jgi:beta-glucosidase